MYIIKNAFKCMSRSKGRNLLIGIIVLVISVSACLGLSIRQASLTAKQKTMDSMTVTATISFDRNAAMKDAQTEEEDGTNKTFDRSEFAQMMGQSQNLSLEEYLTYAKADSVKDFYYTLTASLNGSDEFEPVTNEEEEEETAESVQPMPQMPQGEEGGKKQSFGGRNPQKMGAQNDFSVVGYSGESAMTDFINGTSTITSGAVFGEATTDYNCLISAELATFNELAVGDTVVVANPSNEDETYTLTVVGLYEDTTANEESFSIMGSTSTDPANKIYMSYAALKKIMDASSEDSTTVTDSDTGREYNTALQGSLAGTYVFANTDDYYAFEQQVRTLGLDETYTVYSTDIQNFESSLVPLNTLSTMAGYFLLVVLAIGAVILVVLNIFNVRERKYEIGVLTAMGMKKYKVALQFLTEIFAVTLAAVIIGLCVGGVASVPVTNKLLENQVTSQQQTATQVEQNFGRGPAPDAQNMQTPPDNVGGKGFRDMFTKENAVEYVTEINSAMNLTVVLQMLGIAVLLTLVAGAASMMFIMRYQPLKILANRD